MDTIKTCGLCREALKAVLADENITCVPCTITENSRSLAEVRKTLTEREGEIAILSTELRQAQKKIISLLEEKEELNVELKDTLKKYREILPIVMSKGAQHGPENAMDTTPAVLAAQTSEPSSLVLIAGDGPLTDLMEGQLALKSLLKEGAVVKQGTNYREIDEHLALTKAYLDKRPDEEEKNILWFVGMGDLLSAKFRPAEAEKVLNKILTALNEVAELPGVYSVTWATLVTPPVESLTKAAEMINDKIFEWVQEEEKKDGKNKVRVMNLWHIMANQWTHKDRTTADSKRQPILTPMGKTKVAEEIVGWFTKIRELSDAEAARVWDDFKKLKLGQAKVEGGREKKNRRKQRYRVPLSSEREKRSTHIPGDPAIGNHKGPTTGPLSERELRWEETTPKDMRSLLILPVAEENLPIEGKVHANPTGETKGNRIRGPALRKQKQLHRKRKRGGDAGGVKIKLLRSQPL